MAEAAALAAGTHREAMDDFGNVYVERVVDQHQRHVQPCNCKCAYMPCQHRRREHDRPGGGCGRCGCGGFL